MIKINVLTDYRGWLFSSVKIFSQQHIVTMDLDKLKQYAKEDGIELNIMKYTDVDLREDYRGQYFIYTSSEDPGLIYKSYLEDVAYALTMKGAILIPEWKYMKAHHNKALMEMIRDVDLSEIDTGIHSSIYGCNEEFIQDVENITFPCVYKAAEGAGSRGVALFESREHALAFITKENENHHATLKEKILKLMGREQLAIHSNYRRKFIIQNFIPNLNGDYKVLVFGNKYYALSRQNRDNDFRASGGGRLNYEPVLPEGIFDFAKSIFDALNLPVLSVDIAFDGKRFYLIEFQCCHFGTATLENSTHYYTFENELWVRQDTTSILEKEYIHSIKDYIQNHS